MELKPQTILQGGRYVIHGVLGRGGFGVTYLAEQVMAKRRVCIKEFFPKDYYTRGDDTRSLMLASQGFATSMNRYKEKFVKEAQTIAALDHHNIIPIYDVFEENNTAYYVMEYIDGESLSDVIKRRGALSESEAVDYICQAGSALEYLHDRRIMHLDVKPGNIMVRRKDNRVVLIDFGLSKHYDAQSGEATSTTPVGVSHGYAPLEQYKQGGVSTFSPETDIYSLGATLYALVVGRAPAEAATLITESIDFPQHVSSSLRNAIIAAMAPSPKQRPASVREFMAMLGGVGVSDKSEDTIRRDKPIETDKKPIDQNPEPQTTNDEKTKTKKSKWWVWCLLIAIIAVGLFVRSKDGATETLSGDNEPYTYISVDDSQDESEKIAIGLEDVVKYNDKTDNLDESENDTIIKYEDEPAPASELNELKLMSKEKLNFDHNKSQGTISYSLTNTDDVPNVTSNKSWVTINSVSKSGTINFSVAANSGKESRDATIKVEFGGQYFSVSVTQSGKPVTTYKVGDYYNENGKEGVVFEVWDGGCHGKIVSLDATSEEWDSRLQDVEGIETLGDIASFLDSNLEFINDNTTYANSESDGKANTDKLMSRNDSQYFEAAKWCRDKGKGWYLPAKLELEKIIINLNAIKADLSNHGRDILDGVYWSSTEEEDGGAWVVGMDEEDLYVNCWSKFCGWGFYVRAVSAF